MNTPRQRGRVRRLAVASSLMLIVSVVSAPAMAYPPTEGGQGVSKAGFEDAIFDARTSDRDVEVIEDDIAFQEEVNGIVDPVIIANEDVFSEAGFNGDGTAYIAFTQPIPEVDAALIANHPNIELIEDAPLTASDADILMVEVSEITDEAAGGGVGSLVHVSPLNGKAVVATPDALSPAEQNKIRSVLEEATPSSPSTRGLQSDIVDFDVDKTLEADAEAVNGGDTLTIRNTTSQSCTAAFPARSGSNRGLLTAGHCANNLTVDSGNRLYSATHSRTRANGDMQWHRSRETVNPRFRHAWGSYRPVSAHPVLKVGTSVCRFGAVSGNGSGCTTVTYVSSCIAYDNIGTYCKLAMTRGHTGSRGGDSGGPYYYGQNAYGIHSGSGWRDGIRRNYFYPSRIAVSINGLTPIYG